MWTCTVPEREVGRTGRRGPAPVLLLAGLGALAVSVGVGFGALASLLAVIGATAVDGRWFLVGAALLVGTVLVLGPRRRR